MGLFFCMFDSIYLLSTKKMEVDQNDDADTIE